MIEENQVQELYNKFIIKKQYNGGDVVLRLSLEEAAILLQGLKLLGASEKLGLKALEDFQNRV